MKNMINENNTLPLTFKYVKTTIREKGIRKNSPLTYYTKSKKYQTDFRVMEKPLKQLTRLL